MADASGLWIPVLPSMKEFGPALTKGVAKEAEGAGKTTGLRFGKALALSAATVAGVAAAGTALFNVGKTFQDMTNTIRVGTGAAGDDLDSLVDIAKNVGTQVPHDFDSIGNAVADLNTMMGLTGDDLETVSAQILEAGRMLGEEVDISAVGQTMNAFGVETEDVSGQLDFLFNVSQATGIGMNDLANQARQAAPAAEVLGFSFEETAGLIGQLDNAGLDSGKMLQNMSRRMKDVAKDGEEPRDTFNRVAGEIQEMVESGDRFGAQDLAGTAFGTRNAEQFIKAIEDGTMNLDDLTGAAAHSGDTIMGLSEETMTFSEHWEIFKNKILVALEPVAARVFGGMGDLMDNLSVVLTESIIPAFEGFVDWLGRAKTWLVPLGAAVGALVVGILAVNSAMAIWTTLTNAWKNATLIATGVQKAFNAVIKANPIGLIITAITALVGALVWFFTQTEIGKELWAGFTSMMGDAWDWVVEKVGGAATWLWEEALEPFFSWVSDTWSTVWDWLTEVWDTKGQPIWDAIYAAAMWIWEEALLPFFGWLGDAWGNLMGWLGEAWETWGAAVWNAIETAALWLWEKVLEPIFSWIGSYWGLILTGMQLYWENVLKPVWNAIVAVATWLWEKVLEPVFSFIGRHWDKILTAMQWAWTYILKPVWDAIVAVATWLWEKVLEPIFSWIGDHWDEILFAMKYTWENYLLPAWERMKAVGTWLWEKLRDIFTNISDKWTWLKDTVVDVYEKHIKPVFDKFGDIVSNLKDKFKSGVDNIKKQWDRLKSIAAKPVKFVIEDIFNDGLINALNKVPGVNIPDIPTPKWANEYASGGWTGPGSKYTPAGVVHADEYVLNKEATNSLRRQVGLAGLDYMNRHGRFPGYDTGGLVQPVNGPLTSRYGPRWGGMHSGVDWAVPVGTPVLAALAGTVVKAAWNAVTGRTGMGMLLAHSGNRNTYYGHLSAFRKNEGDQVAAGETIGLSGNTGNSTGPHLHFETWTGGRPVNPLGAMGGLPTSADGGSGWFDPLAPIRAIGEKITGWLTSKFPEAEFMVDAAVGLAKDGFDQVMSWVQGVLPGHSDTGTSGAGMGAASAATREAVRGVAAKYGWDSGAQWNALSELIQRESSWNPNAANPSSSARGLFQKMTSIHGPVASTAAGQAGWGLNYIKNRHTNPISALAFHDRNNWYADGGLVTDALFRDQGGNLPPGLSMVLNKTGRDEAILNSRQWQDIHSLAARNAGGSGVNIENAYALSTEALARDIETSRRRAAALAPVL